MKLTSKYIMKAINGESNAVEKYKSFLEEIIDIAQPLGITLENSIDGQFNCVKERISALKTVEIEQKERDLTENTKKIESDDIASFLEKKVADFSSLSQQFPPIFFNYHGILKEENEFSLFHTCSQLLKKKRLLLLQSWLPCFCERGNKEHFIFVF